MKIKRIVKTEQEVEIPALFKIEENGITKLFKVGEDRFRRINHYGDAGYSYASLNNNVLNEFIDGLELTPITEQEWQEAVNEVINEIKGI